MPFNFQCHKIIEKIYGEVGTQRPTYLHDYIICSLPKIVYECKIKYEKI